MGVRILGISIVAAAMVAACGTTPRGSGARTTPTAPAQPDAPYDLADDNDLDTLREQFDLVATGNSDRKRERQRLAAAYASRLDAALTARDDAAAYQHMHSLLSLWEPEELSDRDALTAGLAPFADALDQVRDRASRSGADVEAATAMYALAATDPARVEALTAEFATMFAFADDLAVARFGEGSQRARPVEILEAVIDVFPARAPTDQLIELYQARQAGLASQWQGGNPDIRVLQAHGDGVFRTGWKITRALVRAGRLAEAPTALATLSGVGEAPELRVALDAALAASASPADWLTLAGFFLDDSSHQADLVAARRVAIAGALQFPDDAELAEMVAAIATEADHLPLAIDYLERAHAIAPGDRDVVEQLARLYEIRLGGLAMSDRAHAALDHLRALEQFCDAAARRWPDEPLSHDMATAYATMARGLVSQGELALAVDYLERAIERRPTHLALEHLGTVHLKQGGNERAIAVFERAMKLPVEGAEQRFSRGRMRRLLGEAYTRQDQRERAMQSWSRGLEDWHAVLAQFELPPRFQAEVFTESGRLMWEMGERADARRAFDAAVDVDPKTASAYPDIVSFLIVRGQYQDALDAYHRALGAAEIGDYFKVYMSLWVLAEARRTGLPDDLGAVEYLTGRQGPLWHDQLAQFAVGKLGHERLLAEATTRGRRAELDFYAAMLSIVRDDPAEATALLRRVLTSNMVLFFEYDMATYILRNDLIEASAAGRRERR